VKLGTDELIETKHVIKVLFLLVAFSYSPYRSLCSKTNSMNFIYIQTMTIILRYH
jgi:hypothetical protein